MIRKKKVKEKIIYDSHLLSNIYILQALYIYVTRFRFRWRIMNDIEDSVVKIWWNLGVGQRMELEWSLDLFRSQVYKTVCNQLWRFGERGFRKHRFQLCAFGWMISQSIQTQKIRIFCFLLLVLFILVLYFFYFG